MSVIYLKSDQAEVLNEAGISPSLVTKKLLQERLPTSVFVNIMCFTNRLKQSNNFLNKMGYTASPNDHDTYYDLNNDADAEYLDTLNKGYYLVDCASTLEGDVIWERNESILDNSMFKESLLNVLESKSKLLGFNNVKNTAQFERMVALY